MVYVLRLEDDNYYIGYTNNLERRLGEHFSGRGAQWTKLHKPIELIDERVGDKTTEAETTLEYAERYGADKVRGAGWCRVDRPCTTYADELDAILYGRKRVRKSKNPNKSVKRRSVSLSIILCNCQPVKGDRLGDHRTR